MGAAEQDVPLGSALSDISWRQRRAEKAEGRAARGLLVGTGDERDMWAEPEPGLLDASEPCLCLWGNNNLMRKRENIIRK
jgi:hypothetical protein